MVQTSCCAQQEDAVAEGGSQLPGADGRGGHRLRESATQRPGLGRPHQEHRDGNIHVGLGV